MDVEPIPQGESVSPQLEVVRRTYAAFICVACGHIFAGDIPALFEDLPSCPLCDAQSWIYRLLEFMS